MMLVLALQIAGAARMVLFDPAWELTARRARTLSERRAARRRSDG